MLGVWVEPRQLDDIFNESMSAKAVFKNKDILTDRHVPEKIPHREEQIGHIARILAPTLRSQRISNLFIFGTA